MFGTTGEAFAQSPVVFAQVHPHIGHSYAEWVIQCLGLFGLLSMLSGLAIFIGAGLVVALARRPAVIASYMVFLLVPLLFGILAATNGTIASFSVIALSDTQLKQSQLAGGLAEAMLPLFSALGVTIPSYLVLAIGLFVCTLFAEQRSTAHGRKTESPRSVAASAKEANDP
jgi:hypothetical protein